MRYKYLSIFIICSIFCFCFLYRFFFMSTNNKDLFNEIISKTNSKVMEYGVKAVFETNDDGEEACKKILKDMNLYEDLIKSELKGNNTYCIEINKDNLSGYIESVSSNGSSIITIDLIQKDNENKLDMLTNRVNSALGRENKKVFQYIKTQTSSKDICKLNEDIIKILKNDKAKNIDTIKIENGYSTVAFTKKYEQIKDNGKYIDFNYSLSNYTFGSYLVIGTPVIMTTY